jgi:hypothetical protein
MSYPNHVKIYMLHFDIGPEDIWWCEGTATQHKFKDMQIHHIQGRGKGMDIIENLMCLQPRIHTYAHGGKKYVSKSDFLLIHRSFLAGKRVAYLK